MENLPSILTPDLGLLFWMLIAFLAVFIILAIFCFPVITTAVTTRKRYIDDSLQKAHEASERLEHIREEGDRLHQEARAQQALILQEAAAARDAIMEKAQEKAREESTRLIEEARKQIETERQGAIRAIRAQVAVLSVAVAEKVLRKKLADTDQQMQLIDNLLDEVSDNKQ